MHIHNTNSVFEEKFSFNKFLKILSQIQFTNSKCYEYDAKIQFTGVL